MAFDPGSSAGVFNGGGGGAGSGSAAGGASGGLEAGSGGYGGGGGSANIAGGGGGGYGGGGGAAGNAPGGGGGSFLALGSLNTTLSAGVRTGNGLVTIEELPSTTTPEPATFAVLGAGLVGLAVRRRRRR